MPNAWPSCFAFDVECWMFVVEFFFLPHRRQAMSEILLSARGRKKTYLMGKRSLEVLRGVDIEIARGDFVALRGASGTGKSTLLHLLGGLDTPNAGEIVFRGQKLSS